jgi:hypothetical protein
LFGAGGNKDSIGGVIFRGQEVVGIHTSTSDKDGHGALLSALIHDWAKVIQTKGEGHQYLEAIIGKDILMKHAAETLDSRKPVDPPPVPSPAPSPPAKPAEISPADLTRHSVFFNITTQDFVAVPPNGSNGDVFHIDPTIINEGFSIIGT